MIAVTFAVVAAWGYGVSISWRASCHGGAWSADGYLASRRPPQPEPQAAPAGAAVAARSTSISLGDAWNGLTWSALNPS